MAADMTPREYRLYDREDHLLTIVKMPPRLPGQELRITQFAHKRFKECEEDSFYGPNAFVEEDDGDSTQ